MEITAGAEFALFWKAMAEPEMEAFPCFQEWNSRASFSTCIMATTSHKDQ